MNTLVLQPSAQQKQAMLAHYDRYRQASKNPYIEAFFKLTGASLSIYTSGKVVFQGEMAEQEARRWGYEPEASDQTSIPGQDLPMIGTDEVGNGSYFGGLAVVASFVRPEDHAFLKSLGVDDSKKMTDQKICQIAPLLKEKIPHQALLLSPKKYNEVIEQGYNAVSVKVALHNQAIFLLLQKGAQPEKIVIDAFTSSQNYQKYLKKEANQFANPVTLEEKAEGKYLAVAVSSIIARSMFLENLTQLGQLVGRNLPSGAGSKSDHVAASILKEYGLAGLNQTAKLHFANTQKAQKLLKWGINMGKRRGFIAFLAEWGTLILFMIALFASRYFLWDPVSVDGHSMDPTLQHQEKLVMLKTTAIDRFDIVVASETDSNGKEKLIVKRVVGMPGDTIRYENDVLYINDQEVDEPYLDEFLAAFQTDKLQEEYAYNKQFQAVAQAAQAFTQDANGSVNFTVTIPEGQYYLLGDDRLVSLDSRSVGTFAREKIKGEVVFRIWPFNRIGTVD